MRGRLPPLRRPPAGQIDPLKQHRQLVDVDRHARRFARHLVRERLRAALQTFVYDREAPARPRQELHLVLPSVHEHENVAAQRVARQHLPYLVAQTIERLAQVARGARHVHPTPPAAAAHHDRPLRTCAISDATHAAPTASTVCHLDPSKLARIHQSLADAEAAVESFVRVCNGYLVGKAIVFDDRKYAIEVRHDAGGDPLELRHLSSGEKQIVSLFTHVYLGEASSLSVLIDEPELSLSVPWQKRLLPDIRRSGRCKFLAAVTHSPFIYDNELRAYATDLQDCINSR